MTSVSILLFGLMCLVVLLMFQIANAVERIEAAIRARGQG